MIDSVQLPATGNAQKKVEGGAKWQCFCKYFEAKFASNAIAWAVFLLASIAYDFIIKTGSVNGLKSDLSFQDLAGKVNLPFVIISTIQFFLILLLFVGFLGFNRKKSAGQILEVEVSAITSIANYYFVTVGNYWIVRALQNKNVQQALIDPWQYLWSGLGALALAAFCYWVACNSGLVGDIGIDSVGKQQPPP